MSKMSRVDKIYKHFPGNFNSAFSDSNCCDIFESKFGTSHGQKVLYKTAEDMADKNERLATAE